MQSNPILSFQTASSSVNGRLAMICAMDVIIVSKAASPVVIVARQVLLWWPKPYMMQRTNAYSPCSACLRVCPLLSVCVSSAFASAQQRLMSKAPSSCWCGFHSRSAEGDMEGWAVESVVVNSLSISVGRSADYRERERFLSVCKKSTPTHQVVRTVLKYWMEQGQIFVFPGLLLTQSGIQLGIPSHL